MGRPKASAARGTTTLTGWRQALIFAVLAAFSVQTYVVQTHIHFAPGELAKAVSESRGHHDKFPANDDPSNCPICQELLHSGQFLAPGAQALQPPTLAVSTIAIVDTALPYISVLSHSWHGRAPPLS